MTASESLTALGSHTYLLPGMTALGLVTDGSGGCVLIDSGLDDGYARRVLRVLDDMSWRLHGVINTHSHGDHCGGNALLQKRTEAVFYAAPFEAAVLENPIMEPYYLYSAAPPPQLQTKFLMAEATRGVVPVKQGVLEIGGCILKILPLYGHSPQHTGILTTDGILFAGDAMFPVSVWEKYKLPYFADIAKTLKTLEAMAKLDCSGVVLSHCGIIRQPAPMAEINLRALRQLLWDVKALFETPLSREDAAARLIQNWGMPVNMVQYLLLQSTISAMLTYFTETKVLAPMIREGRLMWASL